MKAAGEKRVPILLPSAPKYAGLARWTAGQIRRFWPGAPETIFCGLPEGGAGGADGRILPLREDPGNWMRVVRAACAELLDEGCEQVYLLLDDHPPIAECAAELLAGDVPRMARELGMTSLVLGGYGPLNRRKGRLVQWGKWRPECLPVSEPWKLPLHPALWSLERLHGILDHLIGHLPENEQTPWAFERIGSNAEKGGVRPEWLAQCWRVPGWAMATPGARALHGWRDYWLRQAIRVCQIDVLAFSGAAGQKFFRERTAGLWHPRIGPYPCFWSGVMKKGRLNEEYLFYAGLKGRGELVEGLAEAFGSSS